MTDQPVLAAHRWPTNAHLIADVARLGYLNGHVLDATYGRGRWWTRWTPDRLTAIDLDPTKARDAVADFTRLPFRVHAFDAIAFDPPYVSIGGRKTSTIDDFTGGYGIDAAPSTPAGVSELIADGLAHLYDFVRPRGHVLVKIKDYVSSGRLWPGSHYALASALAYGYELVDRFEHVGKPGPQPKDRTRRCYRCLPVGTWKRESCTECAGAGRVASVQQHARRNLSTLLVLRTGKPSKPRLF